MSDIEMRRRVCRGAECGIVFFICRFCDRGHCYCSKDCRRRARLAQRRQANRRYQASRAAKIDHADRQRAYIQRRKQLMKKVTGQGIEETETSVMIDSRRIKPGAAAEKAGQPAQKETCYAESNETDASYETSSCLVFCIVCGRSAWATATMAKLP